MEAETRNDLPEVACPGCVMRDRKIAELEARLAKVEALVRSGKRQAAPFSKGVPKPNPKPPGRKSGENYGEHHRRAVPSRIDEVLEAPLPQRCPFCSGEVRETEVVPQYQTEIPRTVIHRQINVHIGHCMCCKERVQGRHALQTSDALGACAIQIGPDAQALAVQLNKDAGLRHGKVAGVFKAAFDLDLARSAACRIMLRAAKRCEPAYQAIVRRVRQSSFIVPDETGWRIGGLLAWLHAAVGDDATAYLIHRRRGYEAAVELIGCDYEGFLIHDGWSPYEQFDLATHQTCLAHLLRRAHEMEDSAVGGAVRFPRAIKAIFQQALAVRDQRDAGELTPLQAREQARLLREQLDRLVIPHKTNADNERFAKFLCRQQESLFTFPEFEGVDATNHRGEQAIRPAVVNRKVWGGNRTQTGAEAQSILMSVIRTAAQRGIETMSFISGTLKATLGQLPNLFPNTA